MHSGIRSSARFLEPRHYGMFAVDIASFGRLDPRLGLFARETLYHLIEDACDAIGVCWDGWYSEDRGDGVVALSPPALNIETLVDQFAAYVRAGIACHNKVLTASARLRVRMAIDAGYVFADAHGIAGNAVIRLCRTLNAPAVKTRLDQHPSDFALIVADHLYHEVVSYCPGQVDAAAFRPVSIDAKETHTQAWISLTPTSHPRHLGSAKPAGQHRERRGRCTGSADGWLARSAT
jgi:hypothetical protein